MKPCKPINDFGPPVGKWTVHGTVPETIARERLRLKREAEQRARDEQEQAVKVKPIVRAKR